MEETAPIDLFFLCQGNSLLLVLRTHFCVNSSLGYLDVMVIVQCLNIHRKRDGSLIRKGKHGHPSFSLPLHSLLPICHLAHHFQCQSFAEEETLQTNKIWSGEGLCALF
ncbi:UNVERIFIED_CONTAM: hypothetical protein K2H54_074443 [Gekko kuhli]